MEDRKLAALKDHFDAVLDMPNTYMWFRMPSGLIVGKPITPQEYYSNRDVEDEMPGEQERFFYLKEAKIAVRQRTEDLGLTIIDGLAVSGWGFADRKTGRAL